MIDCMQLWKFSDWALPENMQNGWSTEQWNKVFFRMSRLSSNLHFVNVMSVSMWVQYLMSVTLNKQWMKHPPSVMISGCMFKETLVFNFCLLQPQWTVKGQTWVSQAVHNCSIFMQDGAPCHRSNIVSY